MAEAQTQTPTPGAPSTPAEDRQILDDLMPAGDGRTGSERDAALHEAIGNAMDGDDARAHENIHQGVDSTKDPAGAPPARHAGLLEPATAAPAWQAGADTLEGGIAPVLAPPAQEGIRPLDGAPVTDAGSVTPTATGGFITPTGLDDGAAVQAALGVGASVPSALSMPAAEDRGDTTTPGDGVKPDLQEEADMVREAEADRPDAPAMEPAPAIPPTGDTDPTDDTDGDDPASDGADDAPTGEDPTDSDDPDDGDDPTDDDEDDDDTGDGDSGGDETGGGDDPADDDEDDGDDPSDDGDDPGDGDDTDPPDDSGPDPVRFRVDNTETARPDFVGDDVLSIDHSGAYSRWGADMDADTSLADGDGASITVDAWNEAKSVRADSDQNADVSVDNFVHADVYLGEGGDSTVIIDRAKRGHVETGSGNDTIDIDAQTNNAGWINTFHVDTGAGDDAITATGDKGITRFVVESGEGSDAVVLDGAYASSDVDLDAPGADEGAGGNDRFEGGVGADNVRGGGGDDTLLGGAGSDTLDGGSGSDIVDAGAGDDVGILRTAERSDDGDTTVYDGGDGTDTLRVEVDDASLADAEVMGDLRAMRDAIRAGGDEPIAVDSLNLEVSDWEDVAIVDSDGNAVDLDADGVTLDAADATGREDTPVALNISAALIDTDGSETLGVTIQGVPEDATLSAGTRNADGSWTLEADDLDGLSIRTAENWNGSFDLTVEATSTELSGDTATATQTMTVDVTPVNDGPVISGLANIIRVTNVNDLVYKHNFETEARFPDLSENHRLDPSKVNGVDPDNMTLQHDYDVSVTFVSEGAGYHNALGWYTVGEDGSISDPQFIYGDATDSVIEKAGTQTVTLTAPDDGFAGKTLGFFLVADGHNRNKSANFWDDASTNQGGRLAFVDDDGNPATVDTATPKLVFIDDDGEVHTVSSNGGIYHSAAVGDTTGLNPDGRQHAISGVTDDGDSLMVGFEDQSGLGDHDFNDIVFTVNVGSDNARQLVPTAVAPGIQIEDIDSPLLASAEARLSEGMQPGDELQINGVTIDADGFIGDTGVRVEVVQDDTGYALRFSGDADQATYTDLLSRVKLQNSGTDPELGDRAIDFTVSDGEASATSRATVRVTDDPNPSDILLDAPEDGGTDGEATAGDGADGPEALSAMALAGDEAASDDGSATGEDEDTRLEDDPTGDDATGDEETPDGDTASDDPDPGAMDASAMDGDASEDSPPIDGAEFDGDPLDGPGDGLDDGLEDGADDLFLLTEGDDGLASGDWISAIDDPAPAGGPADSLDDLDVGGPEPDDGGLPLDDSPSGDSPPAHEDDLFGALETV
ncbi:DUF4114 domain-containing protein [Roseospira marina]|uniref:DUF4114 domain-containing protein n=1 Tax=Roseospira marina TaxID=140057 RepID=A0A5M6IBY4_9PROT|nr:DUF4114 domain-containing protein [Roseospira marina]KAA5605128.1 DUF4114 domain-containing protein [Roseospira marina]MBB4314881.1 hypothetical protein [Roseospira marina]MBB5087881.1 hypothetical protein [Roseospira marina]